MSGETVVIRGDASVEGWRPLVQWFFCIPHLIATGVLSVASLIVALIGTVLVLLTGRVPSVVVAFQVMTVRERVRCFSQFFVLRSDRPPYSFTLTTADPGDDPEVTVEVPVSGRPMGRLDALSRPFVLLPHALVLIPIGVVMDVCYPVWMLLVAVNRGWPPSLARLLSAVEQWVADVFLFALLATDARPQFGLAANEPLHA